MTDPETDEAPAPISLEVVVTRLPRTGMPIRFEASAAERAALAAFLGVVSIESLDADLLVSPGKRDGVGVTGTVSADVVQACVVSLDPVPQRVEEPVDLVFVPESSKLARLARPDDGELHLDPDGADIPETFAGERIDLGPTLGEIVALALDPYPRAGERAFEAFETDPDPSGDDASPFAALRQLRSEFPPGDA